MTRAISTDSITQRALKALELATAHRSAIEPRLTAGTLEGLAHDVETLGAATPQQLVIRREAIASTVTQATALATTAALISATRNAVKTHTKDPATRGAFGVNVRVEPRSPKSVFASATTVLEAFRANPDRGRALGLLDSDITALEASLAAAKAADTEQDAKRAKAPSATKARNDAAKAIERAIARIAAAGVMQFALDPALRASFEALVAGPAKSSAKKAAAKKSSKPG